jgi:hypothetical protein
MRTTNPVRKFDLHQRSATTHNKSGKQRTIALKQARQIKQDNRKLQG